LFRGLSLELKPHEILQVTGANGAGKTTLIRTLAGLSEPYAGDAGFEGSLALLDERLALEPEWPLARALGFWFALDGAGAPEAVMERLALADLADVPVRYLSTGQKKRAGLARLIGQDAGIWLLDEPLSGLDTQSQSLVSALIAEHAQAGGIVLVASHQPLGVPGIRTLAIEDYASAPDNHDEAERADL